MFAAAKVVGAEVVLLDVDLRRPSLHRLIPDLREGNDRGMSSLLTAQASIDEVLRESGVENLKVITSGPIPPSPTELLSSARLIEVLAELSATFDLVLLDLMMPEMNGYEATRAIRQMSGRAQLTRIVAVTANADPEERRKCLDAGMDDYLIKPINLEKLGKALGGIASDVGAAQGVATASDADAIVEGLKSFGDAGVIGELIDLFLSDAPEKITLARQALDEGDANETREVIHSLKGSARNLHAQALAKTCETLEMTAKKGNLKSAEMDLRRIEEELQKVVSVLEGEKTKLGL